MLLVHFGTYVQGIVIPHYINVDIGRIKNISENMSLSTRLSVCYKVNALYTTDLLFGCGEASVDIVVFHNPCATIGIDL